MRFSLFMFDIFILTDFKRLFIDLYQLSYFHSHYLTYYSFNVLVVVRMLCRDIFVDNVPLRYLMLYFICNEQITGLSTSQNIIF